MSRIDPTNPFHIARAYQVHPPSNTRAAASATRLDETAPVGSIKPPTTDVAKPAMQRMLAGVVPGRVSFAGSESTQVGPALPMYRHPADKNAAATSLSAGRMIDVQG
jgi:hypothetical protein